MRSYTLPAVNQRVDVWFDGYDEYYGGRVDSVSAPYRFHVILDDKSSWDIDARKHIFRLSNDLPDDDDPDAEGDVDPTADDAVANVEPGVEDDADAVVDPSNAQQDKDANADGNDTSNGADVDKSDEQTKPTSKPQPDALESRPTRVTSGRRAATAEPDPHTMDQMDIPPDPSPPVLPTNKTLTERARTRSSEANAESAGEATNGTRSTLQTEERPRRRVPGRALRKSTNGPRTRDIEAAPPTTPERPRRAAAVAAKSLLSSEPDADTGTGLTRRRRSSQEQATTPVRVTRSRGGAMGEDGSLSTDARATADAPGTGTSGRRGRPPGVPPHTTVGRKRGNAEAMDDGATTDGGTAAAATKKRKRSEEPSGTKAAATPPGRMTMTRSGAARTSNEAGVGGDRNDEPYEKLSTKAITAIAVEAALESAKAVLKPVKEGLNKALKSLELVTKELVANKQPVEKEVAKPGGQKAQGPLLNSTITAAALENFQVDVSEMIGGGEARIKAYSSLSQQEFEGLHRVIEQQGKALRELDRLLYAAQTFGNKAKSTEGDTKAEGDKTGADKQK